MEVDECRDAFGCLWIAREIRRIHVQSDVYLFYFLVGYIQELTVLFKLHFDEERQSRSDLPNHMHARLEYFFKLRPFKG